jgi:hypothetical protein
MTETDYLEARAARHRALAAAARHDAARLAHTQLAAAYAARAARLRSEGLSK